MHRFRHLVAISAALLLVFSQQAAFTHLIGHLGGSTSAQTIVDHEDRGHHDALSLSHSCATCVAMAGLGGPPSAAFEPALATADGDSEFFAAAIPAYSRTSAAYLARAPPALL